MQPKCTLHARRPPLQLDLIELQQGFKYGDAVDGLKTSVAGESVLGEGWGDVGGRAAGQYKKRKVEGWTTPCRGLEAALARPRLMIAAGLLARSIAGALAGVLPGVDPSEVHQPVRGPCS